MLISDALNHASIIDGVFSMQGDLAPLREICSLAERYDALVMVDDSHATGFLGPNGRGTPEELGVADRAARPWSTTFDSGQGPTCSPTWWPRPWSREG